MVVLHYETRLDLNRRKWLSLNSTFKFLILYDDSIEILNKCTKIASSRTYLFIKKNIDDGIPTARATKKETKNALLRSILSNFVKMQYE